MSGSAANHVVHQIMNKVMKPFTIAIIFVCCSAFAQQQDDDNANRGEYNDIYYGGTVNINDKSCRYTTSIQTLNCFGDALSCDTQHSGGCNGDEYTAKTTQRGCSDSAANEDANNEPIVCNYDVVCCPISSMGSIEEQPSNNDEHATDHNIHDSRLIAYVANWKECPTSQQLAGYTHIILAFAVTYTWSASGNMCNEDCSLAELQICTDATDTEINDWKSLGKKVVLSFGGAGMGGSWSGDSNKCWDYCFGKEEQLSTDLVELVDTMGFDGIDLDYE